MSYLYRDCANARNPDATTCVDAEEIRGSASGENNLSGGVGSAEGQIGNVLAGSELPLARPVNLTPTPDPALPAQFISNNLPVPVLAEPEQSHVVWGEMRQDIPRSGEARESTLVKRPATLAVSTALRQDSRGGQFISTPEAPLVLERLQYPRVPGHKKEGTSKLAADSITNDAKTLRDQCLEVLKRKELTSDEVAMYLHRSVLSIRPRCSELIALGLVQETSFRRRNLSGHFANVLRAARGNTESTNE